MERDKDAANRYRKRADQVRTIANDASDQGVRTALKGVAEDYEQLARSQDEGARRDAARKRDEPKSGSGWLAVEISDQRPSQGSDK